MKRVLYILGQLADEDVDWLIRSGRRERVAARTELIREGQPVDKVYIVLEGAFSIACGAGRKREIGRVSAGEVLGELSFLDARPPAATVTSLEEAQVFAVERRALASKIATDPAFAARFYKALGLFLAHRLRGTIAVLGLASGEKPGIDPDEDDSENLDDIELPGARFEFLLKRLQG